MVAADDPLLKRENLLEHNQVNKVLFVVTPLLCQELLKQHLEWDSTSKTTYATIFATTQSSQPSSICGDITIV